LRRECNHNLIAPFTVEGSCNRVVFETWLSQCLIPVLQAGQVIILDNATFHKGGIIRQLIEAAGCFLVYLPPYSPDFNQIEKCWSWLKSRIRKQISQFDSRERRNGIRPGTSLFLKNFLFEKNWPNRAPLGAPSGSVLLRRARRARLSHLS